MASASAQPVRTRGRGSRPWLLLVKFLGLCGFFGGVAAIVAMGLLVPPPSDVEGWMWVRLAVRAIFWPCVFGGLVVTMAAGVALLLRHPRTFFRMRWFRLKLLLVVVLVPGLHLTARGRVQAWYEAIDAGRLDELPARWREVTVIFAVAGVLMLAVAAVGRIKPRLGEAIGRRAPRG